MQVIDVDPYDDDHVMVTISNFSSPSIFESRDGGNNWTDVGGNLEENPDGSGSGPSVQWIEQLGDEDLFFVGTSTGVYCTDQLDGTSTDWTFISEIGNVPTPQLRIKNSYNDDPTLGLVVAGTHGNGLFSATYNIVTPTISNVEVVSVDMLKTYDTFGTGVSIVATIRNVGNEDLSNFEIEYTVDGNTPVIEAIASLAVGETIQHTFPNIY